jgi:hypothetical protein
LSPHNSFFQQPVIKSAALLRCLGQGEEIQKARHSLPELKASRESGILNLSDPLRRLQDDETQEEDFMFRTRVCTGICLLLIGCVLPVLAQQPAAASNAIVPPMVKFSGTLNDASGKPLTEVVGVTFLLYKDSQGGAPLWMESQNVQPDKSGHYTVMLGSSSSQGLPPDVFVSGEARWLGAQAQGQAEQPRTVLLSVPYALKAADAETIGGLPPSAFVLAAPASSGATANSTNGNLPAFPASGQAPAPSNVTTSGGTVNALPLWTTATNIQSSAITQTGSGKTAKVGINTTKPASALDVNGAGTVRGNLSLPATSTATTLAGKDSQPTTITTSVYNSTVGTAVAQNFRWQAEPVGNNTANATGSLNLLFGSGSNSINETGLNIGSTGQITFANGQTFPGTGTITGVTAGTDLTGGGSSGNVTLNLDTTKVPQLSGGNSFTGDQTVQGNVSATGQLISTVAQGTAPLQVSSSTLVPNLNASLLGGLTAGMFATQGANNFVGNQSIMGTLGIGTSSPTESLDLGNGGNAVMKIDPGDDSTEGNVAYELIGRGRGGVPNKWSIFTAPIGGGFGVPANSLSIWQYPPNGVPGCCLQRFTILPAEAASDTGGTVAIDQNGNASQARTAGGLVKAMVYVNGQDSPYGIIRCFNSFLTGAAATTPPCGFNLSELQIGWFTLDFGFEVDDRFLSATIAGDLLTDIISVCTSDFCTWLPDNHTVSINTLDANINLHGRYFHLIVY